MKRAVIGARSVLGLLLVAGFPGAVRAQEVTPPEWQPGGRVREYGQSLLGPPAIVDVGVAAGLDQWRDEPEEWDQDIGGFGQRLASNAGRNAVEESARHGLAALMDRSVTYQRCTCSAVGGRVWNAFLETITDRDREGDRLPAIPRLAGSVAGAYAESSWRPGEDDRTDVVRIATRSVLFGMLGNLWTEFVGWP
jgi:hypothetical protein